MKMFTFLKHVNCGSIPSNVLIGIQPKAQEFVK
uniref:Uncharacterized protein n=1 Tax=Lepeophtheirus salmonis TaxID=72036 RepID=A0A0K2V005_LEPSM